MERILKLLDDLDDLLAVSRRHARPVAITVALLLVFVAVVGVIVVLGQPELLAAP